MPIIFSQSYKHDRLEFFPGVSLSFEDPDAEPFFKKVGVAADTTEPPVRTYSQDEVSIDPETIFADGSKVLDALDGDPPASERQGLIQPDDQIVETGNG